MLVFQQETIQNQLLKVFHDSLSGGHWDQDKTLERLQRQFCWNKMFQDIKAYVATCSICQNKAISRHRSYGELQLLPIPTNTWNASFKEVNLD